MRAAEYNDIGRYLKDSRESLRLSISDAAQAMHIRTHYVEALENGNLEVLPGKAYVRGYIKNYALYLGINANETLEAYDALSGVIKRELYIPEPTVKENLPSRALLFIALAAACIMLSYYVMTRKESHVITPSVAEVPATLLLEAEGVRTKYNADWMDCLKADVNECFNPLYSGIVLSELKKTIDENVKTFALPTEYVPAAVEKSVKATSKPGKDEEAFEEQGARPEEN